MQDGCETSVAGEKAVSDRGRVSRKQQAFALTFAS